MWVVDHLDDLESDFSTFHRVADLQVMEGPRFFRMAYRMSLYGGAMAFRVQQQERTAVGPRSVTPDRRSGQEAGTVTNAEFLTANADVLEVRKVS